MSTNAFKAGVIQFHVAMGDVDANMEKSFAFLGELVGRGASLAVLPEMFPCGFDNEALVRHAAKTPAVLERLSAFARQHAMAVAGSFPEASEQGIHNTLYMIDKDGEVRDGYRKLHLFRLTDEHRYFSPGSRMVTADTAFGRMGLMICYDLRFPELARSLTLAGARILIVPAQWPTPRAAHWQTLLRARAIENQVFVIGANRTGADEDLTFPGLSAIIDPWGQVLAEAGDEDGIILAEIDMARVDEARGQIPVMTDRRNDIYG